MSSSGGNLSAGNSGNSNSSNNTTIANQSNINNVAMISTNCNLLSSTTSLSTSLSSLSTSTIRNRNSNVSVTNIKCENDIIPQHSSPSSTSTSTTIIQTATTTNGDIPITNNNNNNSFFNGGSIRISVPKVEDSDESESELSIIENSKVNRRLNTTINKNGPRPMSWEGELSETDDLMDIENSVSNDKQFIDDSQMSTTTKDDLQHNHHQQQHHQQQQQHQQHHQHNDITIKNDYEQITSTEIGSSIIYTSGMQKKYNEIINLKHEIDGAITTTTTSSPSSSTTTPTPTSLTGNNSGGANCGGGGLNSPLLNRSKTTNLLPANPSPDSAIHSVYTHSSPSQSPLTSRHAPYTPSLSRNNSDASHSSCYSYSSEFSPTHSPIQGRHNIYGNYNGSSLHHSVLYRPILDSTSSNNDQQSSSSSSSINNLNQQQPTQQQQRRSDDLLLSDNNDTIPSAGISRQQLINSPCPICGDKISGFHYGIFSCESCKGFFKRTVQNRKNYVCVRGGPCPVTISTRKKCPACRFDKCLQKGMKLEAIREDRTRGGRSTYQCSYTLPNSLLNPIMNNSDNNGGNNGQQMNNQRTTLNGCIIKSEQDLSNGSSSCSNNMGSNHHHHHRNTIPTLLQEIMDVEHLWQYNENEISRLNQATSSSSLSTPNPSTNPLLASAGISSASSTSSLSSSNGENTNPDLIANLCNVADHRLYKIVKWCKSLPLFKHISIDDQICLLINSWCELLLFSCCFRSIATPGEIKISLGKSITLAQAKSNGLQACIERMLNLTDHLRRLRVDRYEYVAMKVIVLLQSDTSELREPVKVRESQEKALQALQAYTLAHYPESPAKFGELLLRIPELQRTCQLGKEMLTIKSKDGEDFNLLMELLRGEH